MRWQDETRQDETREGDLKASFYQSQCGMMTMTVKESKKVDGINDTDTIIQVYSLLLCFVNDKELLYHDAKWKRKQLGKNFLVIKWTE
eukprot:517703-Ditylum_brightwellii.AAC.1